MSKRIVPVMYYVVSRAMSYAMESGRPYKGNGAVYGIFNTLAAAEDFLNTKKKAYLKVGKETQVVYTAVIVKQ